MWDCQHQHALFGHKFTGKERDSESGLDNFGARYDSSQYGRFMSPDPSGGHFMNPQSLNRYAYVHNNPLSMIDPTGLDCLYINDDQTQGTVVRGDCLSNKDNGVYVNGTINVAAGATIDTTNNTLSFYYTPDGQSSSDSVLFHTDAPNPTPASYLGLNQNQGNFGFGSPQYASQLFSQVYQNTRAVTNPKNIAAFYGASAAVGTGLQYLPSLLSEYGPQALAKLGTTFQDAVQTGRFLLQNPESLQVLSDIAQGYTPGPAPPPTWGALLGGAASYIQNNASQISQGFQNVYQEVRGSVPH